MNISKTNQTTQRDFRGAARQYNLLPAGKRMMFGKEVKVAAKKASKVVKAFPASAIKKSI